MRALVRFAGVVAVVLALAGCGEDPVMRPTTDASPEPTADATSPTDPDTTPATPREGATPTPPPQARGAEESTAYFVREHESGLWVEPETHALDEPTVGVAKAAMDQLVAGDTIDPHLTSLAPEGTEVLGVRIDGEVLEVDFSDSVRGGDLGSAAEEAFAQQLAHTAAQFDGITSVLVLVEGEAIESLAGHVDWSSPITPDALALSPITFDSHDWGEDVDTGTVTVGGEANTFEATVELRLVAPDGSVAEETFTTATAGMGERGTWEHEFSLEQPGTWTIEAIEPDPSGGEGRPPFTTSLELEAS